MKLHHCKHLKLRQCHIDFLFSVTWKKIQCAMCCNHFIFVKKSQCAKRDFVFILSNCQVNAFFMKEFNWKIFYKLQFHRFWDENIGHLAFKFVANKNQSGWLTTSHSAQHSFYFFRLNWVGCLFHCNTGTLRKQRFFYPDVP